MGESDFQNNDLQVKKQAGQGSANADNLEQI